MLTRLSQSFHRCLEPNERVVIEQDGIFEFKNCKFIFNQPGESQCGGSVFVYDLDVSLIFEDCLFYNCSSMYQGGVVSYDTMSNQGKMKFMRSCFVGCDSSFGSVSFGMNLLSFELSHVTANQMNVQFGISPHFLRNINDVKLSYNNQSKCYYEKYGIICSDYDTSLSITFSLFYSIKAKIEGLCNIINNLGDSSFLFSCFISNSIEEANTAQIFQSSNCLLLENCIFSNNNQYLIAAEKITLKSCIINHIESDIVSSGIQERIDCTITKKSYSPYPYEYFKTYLCSSDITINPKTSSLSQSSTYTKEITPIQSNTYTKEITPSPSKSSHITTPHTIFPTTTISATAISMNPTQQTPLPSNSNNDSSQEVISITARHIKLALIISFVILILVLFFCKKPAPNGFDRFPENDPIKA